jgi:hypothetical protein
MDYYIGDYFSKAVQLLDAMDEKSLLKAEIPNARNFIWVYN